MPETIQIQVEESKGIYTAYSPRAWKRHLEKHNRTDGGVIYVAPTKQIAEDGLRIYLDQYGEPDGWMQKTILSSLLGKDAA